MAINKNHEFEELDGVKCAIVERNITAARLAFLKPLLEINGYTVVVVDITPQPPPQKNEPGSDEESNENIPAKPSLYTLGVTDLTFNSINAVFGRLLKDAHGKIVTLAYWQQKEKEPHDEVPYYDFGKI